MTIQEALRAMGENFWALVPALTAIILALITKEVYISLFLGVFVGGMIYAGGNPIMALAKIFENMAGSMGPDTEIIDGNITIVDAGHAGILVFILELGILVAMMNKAGGGKAFGNWIHTHIKSRKGALLATTGLGCIMFMDDYFNRLAVGSIMQPVNDQFRISRAKSTFIVGSISVSICMLVPISSWASAITSNMENAGGFSTYIQTIGCNFYPILLLLFLFVTSALGIDLFGLYKHEHTAITTGDLLCGLTPSRSDEEVDFSEKGKVYDLILPIAVLVISCCVLLLIKRSDGTPYFATNIALDMGGCIALIFCLLLYLPRRLMSLKEYTGCFGTGFKSISDVFIILVFAWSLVDICNDLNLGAFVTAFAYWMQDLNVLLPAILFLAAMGCAFATGTSWGTFGIMVPIVAGMGPALGHELMVITMAAVLSGSVFGDQVSPISDATILSAAACKSNHLGYVKAQMPNALCIAGIAFMSFLTTGLCTLELKGMLPVLMGWIVAIVLFAAFVTVMFFIEKKHGRLTDRLYKKVMAEEAAIAVGEPSVPIEPIAPIDNSDPTDKTE